MKLTVAVLSAAFFVAACGARDRPVQSRPAVEFSGDWDAFVAAWPARVEAGQGSIEALARYRTAAEGQEDADWAGCTRQAAADRDAWGEAVCRLSRHDARFPDVDFEQAREDYRRGLALLERLVGTESAVTATAQSSLAIVCLMRGEIADAKELSMRALRILEKTVGPDDLQVAKILDVQMNIAQAGGQFDEAFALAERALEIRRKSAGESHPEYASGLNALGTILFSRGEVPAARENFEKARKIWEAAYGPRHPEVASVLNNLAQVHVSAGDFDQAREAQGPGSWRRRSRGRAAVSYSSAATRTWCCSSRRT